MITTLGCKYEYFMFPSGEPHVRVTPDPGARTVTIKYEWDPSVVLDMMVLPLLANAIRHVGLPVSTLIMDYLPFARQERVATPGDCLSLEVIAYIINQVQAGHVVIHDPHTDDIRRMIAAHVSIVPQAILFRDVLIKWPNKFQLVAPDLGAANKTHAIADEIARFGERSDFIACEKTRDPETGKLSNPKIPAHLVAKPNVALIMVDDICDGGGTFIMLANEFRRLGHTNKIHLMVSHGLFTKGLEVFDNTPIEQIWVRSKQVK